MTALTHAELENVDEPLLRSMLVENSQLLAAATRVIQTLEKQVERLAEALGAENQQVLFANESLENMRYRMYGRKSERRAAEDEAPLFAGPAASGGGSEEAAPSPAEAALDPKSTRKPRASFGRTPQAGLAVRDVYHRHSDDDVKEHSLSEWNGQYETSELITVIPSQIVLERHHRQKYFQQGAEGEKTVVTAPGPLKLKDGSRYSIEFAVEAGLAKYHWHLPLDRQRKMMSAHGLDVSTQTLFDQIDTVAWYLAPTVVRAIVANIEASRVNIADDTTWMNVGKKDANAKDRFHLWAVTNGRATCYSVFDARSRKVAKAFLGKLRGTIVSDGAAAFKILASDDLKLANDWFHVRRKFVAAEKCYKEATFFIDRIREMAKIEAEIKGRPLDEVLVARQTLIRPIIGVIAAEIEALRYVLPRSLLGRALTYTRKLWSGLTVFLDDPEVPMHSNDIERAMYGPAVGRKNHYGSRNLTTAGVAAVWYTVVETCKLNGVDPRVYLTETLTAILKKQPYRLPWEWRDDPAVLLLN